MRFLEFAYLYINKFSNKFEISLNYVKYYNSVKKYKYLSIYIFRFKFSWFCHVLF